MKHNLKSYGILLLIAALSLVGVVFGQVEGITKAFFAAPSVGALSIALINFLREQAVYEKELAIQGRHFQFTIGAASHIANTAFDMHVEFSEKYLKEISEMVQTFFREGETEQALEYASRLYTVRQDYALWLTESIDSDLSIFEGAIRRLGATVHFVKATAGHPQYQESRLLRIDESSELFEEILGLDRQKDINKDYAVEAIKRKVRNILGVEELSMLRERLVKEASSALIART